MRGPKPHYHERVSFLRQYLLAVQFFTRVPVTGALGQWAGFSPDLLRASAAHFPGVGLLVGLVACTTFALLGLALPGSPYAPFAAAVGCTVATVLLTGGIHEIGLAESADALGRAAREQAPATPQEARSGSYGTLALVLALAAKVSLLALLASESPAGVLAALLAAHVLSRFWPLLLVRSLPGMPAAASLKGSVLSERVDHRTLAIAAAWCVAPMAIALMVQGPVFLITGVLFSGLALLGLRRLFAQRLQGFSGDCQGATQQVCEIAFYLGAAIGLA